MRAGWLFGLLLAAPALCGDRVFTTAGPYGGFVTSPVYVSDGILVGSESGLWFLGEGEAVWSRRRLPGYEGRSVNPVLGPSGSGRVYAYLSQDREDRPSVYMSADGGRSFHGIFRTDERLTYLEDVSPSPGSSSEVYLRQRSGMSNILHTTDDGRSWEKHEAVFSGGDLLRADPVHPGVAYASGRDGLLGTEDGGKTWSLLFPASEPGWSSAIARLHVHRTPQGSGVLLQDIRGSWFRSADLGRTWERAYPCGSSRVIDGRADRETLYSFYPRGLCRSTDGGTTWAQLNGEVSLVALAEGDDPTKLVGVDSGRRLRRSTDGGATFAGLPTAGLSPSAGLVTACPEDDRLALATGPGPGGPLTNAVFLTTDRGATWNLIEPADWWTSFAFRPGQCSLVYRSDDTTLRRSTDGGLTFAPVPGAPLARYSRLFTSAFRPDDLYAFKAPIGGNDRAALGRSTDGGLSWALLVLPCGDTRSFAAADSSGGSLWAGCGSPAGGNLYRSTDVGVTWSVVPGQRTAPGQIVPHPTDPGTIWILGHGLSRSTDGGATWTCLYPYGVYSVAVSRLDAGRLLMSVVADEQVLGSSDGGATWARSGLLPPSSGYGLSLVPSPGGVDTLYVGTSGGVQVMTGWPETGDADLSGRADVIDVLLVAACVAGSLPDVEAPFRARWTVADVDASDTLDVGDLQLLQGFLVGNVPSIPTASLAPPCL